MAVLVVGGDSRLARELIPMLTVQGVETYATSRRKERPSSAGEKVVFLDLADVQSFKVPDPVDRMVIVGGVVDYQECVNRYDYAYQVNCVNIPEMAAQLWRRGGYVCFISTNTVFKFERGLPNEDDARCPGFSYAQLKASAEEKLEAIADEIGCRDRMSIMRLTKNVGPETSPFGAWLTDLSQQRAITPFNDLFFAPVRFVDSARAIAALLLKKDAGIFHFSGERDIDYASFARGFCQHAGIPLSLVKGVKSSDVGVKLVYNHPITALGMKRTRARLGLNPVPLATIYEEMTGLFRGIRRNP